MNEVIGWITAAIALMALAVSTWTTLQVRKQVVAAEVDTIDSLYASVCQAYLDYPEMRAVFHEGENGFQPEEMNRTDLMRAASIAEMLCDSMERVLSGEDKGMPEVIEPLRVWVDDMLRGSRYLRCWLREHENWYRGPLVARLNMIEADLSDNALHDAVMSKGEGG